MSEQSQTTITVGGNGGAFNALFDRLVQAESDLDGVLRELERSKLEAELLASENAKLRLCAKEMRES